MDLEKAVRGVVHLETEFPPGRAGGSRRETKHRHGDSDRVISGRERTCQVAASGERAESGVSSALNSRPPVFKGN